MTHDEISELLGAYALDAVSPDEVLEIEQHLSECPRCRAEVAAHREVAGVLGNMSGTAPAGLWSRIADELGLGSEPPGATRGRDQQSPEPPVLGEIGRSGRDTPDDADADADGSREATPAPVIAIGSARSLRAIGGGRSEASGPARRRYAMFGVAASVAVVLAIVVGALSAKVVNLDHQVSALSTAVLNPGVAAQAAAAVNDPQHVTIDLTSTSAAWSAQVVALPDGEAFLVPGTMPALAAGRTFQAWAVVGDKFRSLGVIGRSGAEMQLQPGMTAVLVNTEPEDGASQPTTTPFLKGDLPKSF